MNVLVTNLSAADVSIPAPFDFTLGATGGGSDTREVPIHIRDIVEYRSNPARVDNLREIEQMIKSGVITITPAAGLPARDLFDMDLEEMLFAMAGGGFKRSGQFPTGGPGVLFTVPIDGGTGLGVAGPYRVAVTLEGIAGPFPFEVRTLTPTSFDVSFGAAPWDGIIHWEITYPA
jgi:hypothetical protein